MSYGGHLLYSNDTGLSRPALAWPFLTKLSEEAASRHASDMRPRGP